jgi:hypothetical protein
MKPNSSTTKKPPGVRIKGATPKFFEENEFNTMQIVSYSLVSRLSISVERSIGWS